MTREMSKLGEIIKKNIDRAVSFLVVLGFALCMIVISYDNRSMAYADQYKNVISENYRLQKRDEYGWYDIYDGYGEKLGSAICYGTPLLIRNQSTGIVYLYAQYEDTDAYTPIEVTDELKTDLIEAMGKAAWYVASSNDYVFSTDKDTGIEFMRKREALLDETHVILKSEDDVNAYHDLAEKYGSYFTPADIGENIDIGYIYAEYEIEGMAHRFDDGFMFIQNNSITYAVTNDADKGWTLALTYDEGKRLSEWIRSTDEAFSSCSYEDWTKIFDELEIEYSPDMDPKSPRYIAAMTETIKMWGRGSKVGVSEKRLEEQFRNTMKEYDEDGYRLGVFGVSGMDASGKDPKEWHVLIDIPEEYREDLFEYEKNRIMTSYGLSWDDTKRQIIYRECQLATEKTDRLKCGWTLGQYDRMYVSALFSEIKRKASGWEYGDEFDPGILKDISREDVESTITTKDGINLQITMSPEVREIIERSKYDMALPVMY